MSIHETTKHDATTAVDRPISSRRTLYIGGGILAAFVLFLRLYEEFFGWSPGLDSFASEFQTYWGNLLTIAIPLAFFGCAGVVGYLWRTPERDLALIMPAEETRRFLVLLQLLTVFALALYCGLSFFTEQTAVWHMTAVRDTDFTPANIVTFHIVYPLFAVLGITAFFYAKTRLPYFAKGYSLPFAILVVGTFMTIPNVGFNEWGHTFWAMDEGFAGPLHWGFVFFGWMALGSFGVTLQILGRLRELLGEEGVKILAPVRAR